MGADFYFMISFCNNAERIVRAIRSSSIKYLNTISYMGLATVIIGATFICCDCKVKTYS